MPLHAKFRSPMRLDSTGRATFENLALARGYRPIEIPLQPGSGTITFETALKRTLFFPHLESSGLAKGVYCRVQSEPGRWSAGGPVHADGRVQLEFHDPGAYTAWLLESTTGDQRAAPRLYTFEVQANPDPSVQVEIVLE